MLLINLCFGGLLFFVPILLTWVWLFQLFDSSDHHSLRVRLLFLLLICIPSLIAVLLILSRDFHNQAQFPVGETFEGKLLLIMAHPVMSILAVSTIAYLALNSVSGKVAAAFRSTLIVIGVVAWVTTLAYLLTKDANAIITAYGEYRYYGILNVFTAFTMLGIAAIPRRFRSSLLTLFVGMLGTVLGVLFMRGVSQ
jgi:hypothetical protein